MRRGQAVPEWTCYLDAFKNAHVNGKTFGWEAWQATGQIGSLAARLGGGVFSNQEVQEFLEQRILRCRTRPSATQNGTATYPFIDTATVTVTLSPPKPPLLPHSMPVKILTRNSVIFSLPPRHTRTVHGRHADS